MITYNTGDILEITDGNSAPYWGIVTASYQRGFIVRNAETGAEDLIDYPHIGDGVEVERLERPTTEEHLQVLSSLYPEIPFTLNSYGVRIQSTGSTPVYMDRLEEDNYTFHLKRLLETRFNGLSFLLNMRPNGDIDASVWSRKRNEVWGQVFFPSDTRQASLDFLINRELDGGNGPLGLFDIIIDADNLKEQLHAVNRQALKAMRFKNWSVCSVCGEAKPVKAFIYANVRCEDCADADFIEAAKNTLYD